MKKFFSAVDKANRALWTAASAMLIVIAAATFYEVICRYVFHHSNVWVGEYSGYLFAFIAFLGAPYTFSQGGMTAVDALTGKLKPRGQHIIKLVGLGVGLLFLVLLCYKSTQLMALSFTKGWKSSSALKTPLWIPQLAVPLGSFLLSLTSVVMFIKECMNYKEKKQAVEGQPENNKKEEEGKK